MIEINCLKWDLGD